MPWHFGPFRLDPAQACLWRGEQPVPLRPKTLALLAYLVAHAGQLVTKEALLDAVWPETAVGDGVLKTSMHELRTALGETATVPQCITTVPRRGYRFVAPVTVEEPATPREVPAPPLAQAAVPALPPAPRLIAREAELATLHAWYATALQGVRQVGFITGEAGIGKTTLVDAFVAQLAGQASLWVGQGQCIEQYGAGEAYLPLLEALGQMGHTPDGPHLVARLRQQAPSWLLQLPALLAPGEAEALQRAIGGATRERMLRELAEAVEGLTAARPLVLVVEDLHWSDTATIEWLAYVARRRGPARLLVLGTYRPVESMARAHPVRAMMQELLVHGRGAELSLGEWSEAGVAAYLAQRGAGVAVPATLAQVLTARTDGHPLFLVAVVDELVRQGVLRVGPEGWELVGGLAAVTGAVPPSIRHVLEHQVAQLAPASQALLAAASVAGVVFDAALVAAGLEAPVSQVDTQCEALVRSDLVQPLGWSHWPDGTVTTRYTFTHALYQQTAYERMGVGRRALMHQRLGARLEAAYGPQVREIATELADHFIRGQDPARAVPYVQLAGDNALRRCAHQEAIAHFTTGLSLLTTLPKTPARARHELGFQTALGAALMATQGWGAPEVAQVYARARTLSQQVGESPALFPVLWGLWRFYFVRAQYPTARELAEQCLSLAYHSPDSAHLLLAHHALGSVAYYVGEVATGHAHLEQGLALYEPQAHRPLAVRYGLDLGVWCLSYVAWPLWVLGYPGKALQRSQAARTLAQELAHPLSLAAAWHYTALLHYLRRDGAAAQTCAEAAIALAREQSFPLYVALATNVRGWARAVQGHAAEGMAQMRQAQATLQAMGTALHGPCFLAWLAEAYASTGQATEGLQALTEALRVADTTGEHWSTAELYRLRGDLVLTQPSAPVAEAEACFQQALAVARRQQAKSWELRAAVSLSRLWQRQGKRAAARELLVPVYGWFTEGFDTADLQDARVLLDGLGG